MQKNTQKERNNKVKDTQFFSSRQLIKNNNILGKWRAQAIDLQEQIRNRTFLTRFKEQATEILPEIPKFTENQLLATLEQILLSKKGELNDSYTSNVKNLGLTDNQLRIIKCAEQLVAVRERQSFASNLVDCIRGLNAFNCIKIFVWPVLVDNLPTSFTQNLEELP
ncbi:uncharacterized protein LOC143184116, partial [Calliopsis andreniformis]|uniref:uncharacterized protein LOC143184116 n=1 Tax=Calliopsis andreniformis TaxID=337506 RepID=UPI003FCDC2BA